MFKKISFILILLFTNYCFVPLFAQDYVEENDKKENAPAKRLFFGGDFGLMFGTNTYIELSPQIGYRFTNSLSAGVSITYKHYRLSDMSGDYRMNIYGGSLFSRFYFFRDFLAHLEAEQLNVSPFGQWNSDERIWISNLFAGGGYRQRIGGSSYINFLVLWELNGSVHSPYSSPVFRINFEF